MANDLITYERALEPLAPRFAAVLGSVMNPQHLIQTVLVSLERSKKVRDCSLQSILNAAMTFANLRLPVDGATGQGYLLPFAGVAQPVIGYKGYNTIAARSDVTISGGVVREGDLEWDYREGTGGFVHHKKRLDNPGRIIAAWALADCRTRPSAISVLGIGDIMDVKARSPGAKMSDSPWNDPKIGFIAMAEKTAKRRLARILPFEIDDGRFQMAARVDEAFEEQGRVSYIDDRGSVRTDGDSPIAAREVNETPPMESLMGPKPDIEEAKLRSAGFDAACDGTANLRRWFEGLSTRQRAMVKSYVDNELKTQAAKADQGASP